MGRVSDELQIAGITMKLKLQIALKQSSVKSLAFLLNNKVLVSRLKDSHR